MSVTMSLGLAVPAMSLGLAVPAQPVTGPKNLAAPEQARNAAGAAWMLDFFR